MAHANGMAAAFERLKSSATKEDLYRFLYNMPKGGDLHNHLSGAAFASWWYEEALTQEAKGYRYYTKVAIKGCRPDGGSSFGAEPYLLLYRNIQEHSYKKLPDCEKAEYKPLAELDRSELAAWMRSIELDKQHEGRDEFFGAHWQRLNHLYLNPHLMAELLVRNMKAFAAEGLLYLEIMQPAFGMLKPDGSQYSSAEAVDIYTSRLEQSDASATGVTVRLQEAILRFLPDADQHLRTLFEFVTQHDIYVSVNMVGREDNDAGYPLRFLETLRELRRTNNVPLAIHGGEVDEPNHHVRDTLLLGAVRIGHGLNLITDPDTMRLMRYGPYLVETNLVSNLLLGYVSDYSQHPFPEYLRTGIPVALSTDDRGMWRSNMTDEFYVAVRSFNLTWDEILLLSRNSIRYGFTDAATKAGLLENFNKNIARFERDFQRSGLTRAAAKQPTSHGFICDLYQICAFRR